MGLFDTLFMKNAAPEPQQSIVPHTKFNLQHLKKTNDGYLLLADNRSLFTADLLALNRFLDEGRSLIKNLPDCRLTPEKLIFTEKIKNGARVNTLLQFTPLTKSGRTPKYPVKVTFSMDANMDFFGCVYYGQSCEIEKAEIIMWKRKVGYEIQLAMIQGNLALKEIVRIEPESGNRSKVYYQ